MKTADEAVKLLGAANGLAEHKRWSLPFPMGVFGTLRDGQCNNRRMHKGDISRHVRAFMPNFCAQGLSIHYKHHATAPFEVFFYPENEWRKMIPGVDALEGFMPPDNVPNSYRSFGYFRTLAWLHILPDDFSHSLFENVNLGALRDLAIPQDQWDKYERVPAWVYSSLRENEAARETETVIWG